MNILNKIILRYIKQIGHYKTFILLIKELNNSKSKLNIIFNSCYIDAIMIMFKDMPNLINIFKELKKIIIENDISIQKRFYIFDINYENINILTKYFDKNGIVWISGALFSDNIERYYKKYCGYDFYILIEGGLCSFGNGSLSFNNIIKIKADDFIPYFEKCKKDFNSKLEKIFKSHE